MPSQHVVVGLSDREAPFFADGKDLQYMECGPGMSKPCYNDTTWTTEGHGFYALDLSSDPAGYTTLFSFPKTLAESGSYPYIKLMNGAGLSPIDSYVYALAQIQVSFTTVQKMLIRFGSAHANRNNPAFEYVAHTAQFSVSGGESRTS